MNKARFMIPGMYEHAELNLRFLRLLRDHPEYFYDNVEVYAAYGNFQFCIFDGGRVFTDYRHTTKEEIEQIVKQYNQLGVPVRLIFTNPVIEEKHFQNRFGQVVLNICHQNFFNVTNEIVVNNEKLESYLRERYPNFNYISSTTKCLTSPQAFKDELNKNYSMVCMDYNLNKNQKMLNSIPEELRDKCEFLINAICPPGCPNRKEHYRLNGLFGLSYGKGYATEGCPIVESTIHPRQMFNKNNLTPEEIYGSYVPQGYCNFKLEGRTLGVMENLLNYVRYMVKPEYQYHVIAVLLDEDAGAKVYNNHKIIITPTAR